MVTKDDKPGLLSKVAMFVRNPTKDWSELDQPMDSDGAGYDKQALKAMIERKRQNDFVRKREFDQLRKLRNRDPSALANMARPSFFQTSLPTDVEGRAVTLKKIDEIEAQMSRQWWKSKGDGNTGPQSASQPVDAVQTPSDPQNSEPYAGHSAMSAPFASTRPNSLLHGFDDDFADEFLPTQMASDMASVPGDGAIQTDERNGANATFSTSRLFAIEVDEMETDPELEEAAIRFANGDDSGAENGLLNALRGRDLLPLAARSWAASLLDFYRATKNQQAFEVAVAEFAQYLDGSWLVWYSLDDPAAALASQPAAKAVATPIWTCPPSLTAEAMEKLRVAMVSNPMPWFLGWGDLKSITPDAIPLLEGLFSSLCEEAVTLCFVGQECLVNAMRLLTPSGSRNVEPAWWGVRLNVLRALGLQDDFELAALDYCVTYETAPPAWNAPRCSLLASVADLPIVDSSAQTVPAKIDGALENLSLALRGEVVGDATFALAILDAAPVTGTRMEIDCGELLRVDFAAAGSILNWVAMRQAEGKQVYFQNVHRLVAAFFNVIGINEHAKVAPRTN
jgi:ABC-type transporter Mla MlaB component